MSAQVIWGTDFRKGKEPMSDLTSHEMAADRILHSSIPYEPPSSHDTAPCEMNCAGEKEPA